MAIQSLLFKRDEGWNTSKAQQWAKREGYKHGKVDVTDQYIHIRQFDPKGLKVKRTITLGRGIRAVVAREEDMGAKSKSGTKPAFGTPEWRAMYPRKGKSKRRRAKRARETAKTAVASPRRRRRSRRARETVRAKKTVAAPRRVRETVRAKTVAAPRRRRRSRRARETVRAKTAVAAPRRRRRTRRVRSTVKAWRGQSARHSKAAKKGWARRKRTHTRESVVEARRHRPRRRRAREYTYAQAPRRRRRRHARETATVQSTRRHGRRRRHYARASFSRRGLLAKAAKISLAVAGAGAGYLLADGIDRFLATYNPNGDKTPNDKFTSDGAGTLANTLNVASPPDIKRIGALAGMILVPAFASAYMPNRFAKASLEGIAIGAGVKAFVTVWTNVIVPMLGPKKDADQAALKGSVIARLYPAEVAAKINLENQQTQASASGAGALSGATATDVGPFAGVGDSSPYPDTAQALRREAGLSYPTVANTWGTGSPLPNPAFGIGRPAPPAVNRWRYAHPAFHGYGAQFNTMSRNWSGYRPAAPLPGGHHHHHCMARAKTMYPAYTDSQLHAWCHAHPHHLYPYLYEQPVGAAPTTYGVSADADAAAPPPDAGAAPPPAPAGEAAPAPLPGPPPYDSGPPAYTPGPGSTVGPGPGGGKQTDCACLGDGDQFLGFIGDAEQEKDVLFNTN